MQARQTTTTSFALCAAALLVSGGLALAQEAAVRPEPAGGVHGFFDDVGRWFDRQAEGLRSVFHGAGHEVANFGHEAGIAAETTADSAKGAVAALSNTRVVVGHRECRRAPNGAPDCVTAATEICNASGFKTGSSLDMTSATKCPSEVYLAGRSTGAGCSEITFVSRALCR